MCEPAPGELSMKVWSWLSTSAAGCCVKQQPRGLALKVGRAALAGLLSRCFLCRSQPGTFIYDAPEKLVDILTQGLKTNKSLP